MFLKTRQSIEASSSMASRFKKVNAFLLQNEELQKLESGAGHEIEIIQFIPISKVNPVSNRGRQGW